MIVHYVSFVLFLISSSSIFLCDTIRNRRIEACHPQLKYTQYTHYITYRSFPVPSVMFPNSLRQLLLLCYDANGNYYFFHELSSSDKNNEYCFTGNSIEIILILMKYFKTDN